jgi:hypothetical protein
MQSTCTPGDPGVVAAWWHQRCGDLHTPGRPAAPCGLFLPALAGCVSRHGRQDGAGYEWSNSYWSWKFKVVFANGTNLFDITWTTYSDAGYIWVAPAKRTPPPPPTASPPPITQAQITTCKQPTGCLSCLAVLSSGLRAAESPSRAPLQDVPGHNAMPHATFLSSTWLPAGAR